MTNLLTLLATGELTLKWAWVLALLPLPLLVYLFGSMAEMDLKVNGNYP